MVGGRHEAARVHRGHRRGGGVAAFRSCPRYDQATSDCMAFRGRADRFLGFRRSFPTRQRDLGHVDGQQFDIAYRFADGYVERLPTLAQEMVRLNPSVILAPASGPAVAARKATATIPIVTPALADAMHLGLIAN